MPTVGELWQAYIAHIHPASPDYDAEFTRLVKARFPHWFDDEDEEDEE